MKRRPSFTLGLAPFLVFVFLTGLSCRKQIKYDLSLVHLNIKGHEIEAEVADQPQSRMMGLMFRTEMPKDHGMLFVFPDVDQRAFWMKNTLIPLSIAFMDENGKILNVLEMPPQSIENFFSKGPAKFALEMNRGWYERHGCQAGDKLEGVLRAPAGN
jgi:uncharacterized membrane protein (UPF0127 family)